MNTKGFVKVVVFICFLFSLIVLFAGLICNDDFWRVNVAQALTLIVTICVAFWATQLTNDIRKKKEHAEQILRKIQSIVTDECFYIIPEFCDEEKTKKEIMMQYRALNNSINILKEYGQDLRFEEDAIYIEKEFKDHREFVSEHLADMHYLSQSVSTLRKHSENISSKCDFIVFRLY